MPEVSRFDFFAAAALQGLLAGRNPAATPYTTDEISRVACECAGYMLVYSKAAQQPPAITEPPVPNSLKNDQSGLELFDFGA